MQKYKLLKLSEAELDTRARTLTNDSAKADLNTLGFADAQIRLITNLARAQELENRVRAAVILDAKATAYALKLFKKLKGMQF